MELRWVVDNALNFTPHLAVFALAVAAYAIFGRHWPLAALSLLVVLGAAGYVARSDALLARAVACGDDARLTIATFNVQAGNADLEAFARYVDAEDVDVVVLQELTRQAAGQAETLFEQYPYRVSSTPRWLTILSAMPIDALDRFPVSGQQQGRAIWQATLSEPFDVELLFLHAQTPRSPELRDVRTWQYERVEELLAPTSTPAIVVGDMNATVLDPSFAGLLRATDLRSAVSGPRDSPSWPSGLGFLGIRIDHVLERGLEVCRVERGPSFGSDHRAVVVELAEPATS